jgi:hypothetical protein
LKRIKNNRPQKEEEEEDIFLSNKQPDAGPRIVCSTRAAEASDQDTKILKKEESQACTI